MRVKRRLVTWLAGLLAGFTLLTVLAWVGPAGSAWRANDDFAACVAQVEPLAIAGANGELDPAYGAAWAECSRSCDPIDEPSWLETVGLFVQTRVSDNDEGPSCVSQPGFSDIIPFLPGDSMHDGPPP